MYSKSRGRVRGCMENEIAIGKIGKGLVLFIGLRF
jgi:hypothetical protein